jgi:hypothetical protein
MQFCVTRVILRDLAALVPQIFHSLHKITHFLTGYINSYYIFEFTDKFSNYIFCFSTSNFSLYSNLNFRNVAGFGWKARSLMDKFD